MSDYFKDLEGHLHRAAARQADRRPRVGIVLAALTIGLAVVVALGAIPGDAEREVAAPSPSPSPAGGCADAPPQEILDRFQVFRTEGATAPPEVIQRLEQDLPEGKPIKLWPDASRLARESDGRRWYAVPAIVGGTCLRPAFGVCHVFDGPGANIPFCHPLSPTSTTAYQLTEGKHGDRWYRSSFAEDGVTVSVEVSGREIRGDIAGNVWVAEYEATEAEHNRGRMTIIGELRGEKDCGDAPEFVRTQPSIALGVFSRPGQDLPDAVYEKALLDAGLASANVEHDRLVLDHDEARVAVIGGRFCVRNEPAVCLVLEPKVATEYVHFCGNRPQLEAGEIVTASGDGARMLVTALVPDGTTGASFNGQEMTVDGNLAWLLAGEFIRPAKIDIRR